jgi:hypothetical protein
MITYKIAGLDSVLKSKPENFEGDVLRWKQRSSLPYHAEVTILENDEHNNQPATDSAIDSDLGQLETLSEDTAAPKRTAKRKPKSETTDVQPVSERVDKFDLSDDDSITGWNGVPNDSPAESE